MTRPPSPNLYDPFVNAKAALRIYRSYVKRGRREVRERRGAAARPPLCPRCLLATEYATDCDAYLCPSPVCGGGVTSETFVRTPSWRRVLGWWRPTKFERLALDHGFPVELVNRCRVLMEAEHSFSRAGVRLRLHP